MSEEIKVPKKRGRKPSPNKKKYYFGKEEEIAFSKYVKLTDGFERDKIFRTILYPAFSKLVESIIRTYALFNPLEEFDETYCDTMSFLITKLNNFDPNSGKVTISYDIEDDIAIIDNVEYNITDTTVNINGVIGEVKDDKVYLQYNVRDNKVTINNNEYDVINETVNVNGTLYKVEYYKLYSYCGTICKNYLMLKRNISKKQKEKLLSYDVLYPTADKDQRVDDNSTKILLSFHTELIDRTISQIQVMLSDDNIHKLNDNEQQIGYALLEMLMNWEEIFKRLENKKFNKTSVLFFLKEYTRLNPKEIRDGMKKYKNLYFFTKEKMIKN